MGRPRRILQSELPYHLTSRTVSGLNGFNPNMNQLNRQFQEAISAEWRRQNKPTRKTAVERFAKKVVEMFFTVSERNKKKGEDRKRYDREAVERVARAERLRLQERKRQRKKKERKNNKKGKNRKNLTQNKNQKASNKKFSKGWLRKELANQNRVEQGQVGFKHLSRQIVLGVITLALFEIAKMGFELHHFVLMDTHYHMIGKALKCTIDVVMHKFNLFIAKQMNQLLGRTGAFFAERYKSNIVGTDELGAVLLRYVYQNPVRARVVIVPEDHDFTTYIVYVKGDKFRVDVSGDCPIIEYLCPDKGERRKFVKELVRGQLPADLAARLRFVLRRHVVWMTADTYERLSEGLKEQIREPYIKLDQSLKRYDLYCRI